jgi:hypothetical protein
VEYIHLEQECELLAMVDNIEGQTPTWFSWMES